MGTKFPPVKDADFNSLVIVASAKITASPSTYGLTSGNATQLATATSAWSDAYALVVDPATKTKTTVALKVAKRAALTKILRDFNKIVQGTPTVTDVQKIEIQFPVYASRTPIAAPTTTPVISVKKTAPWWIQIALKDADATRRGMPSGVRTAYVYLYAGATAPTDISQYQFQGSSSKPTIDIALDPSLAAGSKIWLTACWLSPRQQPGSMCDPIGLQVPGGISGRMNGVGSTDVRGREAA